MSYNGITPASQADNEGSIPFTRSTIFKASSGIEVASSETGDSFGDSYSICVEAPVCIPSPSNAPRFQLAHVKKVILVMPFFTILKD